MSCSGVRRFPWRGRPRRRTRRRSGWFPGPHSLGVRVLATGGRAAALGAASPNSVVALASTLSCSFRRDVAPASTLLDVALEADELAADRRPRGGAKSGAADGAWALATWAPAGFADAVGGFNPSDFGPWIDVAEIRALPRVDRDAQEFASARRRNTLAKAQAHTRNLARCGPLRQLRTRRVRTHRLVYIRKPCWRRCAHTATP